MIRGRLDSAGQTHYATGFSEELWESVDKVRAVVPWSITLASTLKERISQSSIWARWAPGLPTFEVFEDDMEDFEGLGEEADDEDNGPSDECWPNCCDAGPKSLVAQKRATAEEATQLEKGEQKAKYMYERSLYDFADCEELLEGIVYPARMNRRGGSNNWCLSTRALILGHYAHGGVCGFTTEARRRPWLRKYLATFVARHNPGAKFSALQISCNAPVSLHRDSHNAKEQYNYVCGFGDYRNGQLWVEDEAAIEEGADVVEQSYGKKVLAGKVTDIHWNFVSFLPRKVHGPMPWEGNRVSLTGYTPGLLGKLGYKDRCYLHQCRFQPPEIKSEEGGSAKYLNVTLCETSLEDVVATEDIVVSEAQEWALEQHVALRRVIAEQEDCLLDEFRGTDNDLHEEKV